MTKTLPINKANLIQEYAYYVRLHSQAEIYLLWSISNGTKAIQQENINRAIWAAQAAITAARCLGLSETFIDDTLLSRSKMNGTDEA